MALPTLPALQRLHLLDKSLSGFQDQLSYALHGEEYWQCVQNLEGDDLAWLVEYLDKALDGLDPSSTAFRRCLRELRSVCGAGGTLPMSYALSPSRLNINPAPFASGGFGDVYTGSLDGSSVCIKRVRVYSKDGSQNTAKMFCQEAVMWKRLTHPNVVPLLGVTINPFQLISSRMFGGELLVYIRENPNVDRLGLLSGVAKGLYYLHSCQVIHGDLKGPNILVDDSGSARIGDFGLAGVTRNLDSVHNASCQGGNTARWTAPEVLKGGSYTKEADIFSFAMVMIEVFTGAIPFGDASPHAATFSIIQGGRPPRPTHLTFTEILWGLMRRCWDHHPQSRPDVSGVSQLLLALEDPGWKRLISPALVMDERISLITMIFSDNNQAEMAEHLSGDNMQMFINQIDEALDDLVPETRRRCLRYLYRICGRHALLPRSLTIPPCYDSTELPLCNGGSGEVWKGWHCGRDVAAKNLRVYSSSDLGQIKRRFCKEVVVWRALRHPNVLPLLGVTMTGGRFVMVSEWMVGGNICEFVKANSAADRLGLVAGITRGLIYMHDQGVIHGNLNGTNILIDSAGSPRLTGFSRLVVVSDEPTATPPIMAHLGAIRWTSPELFDPERFELKECRPTKESDCYALGMVVYEVLSGLTPYAMYNRFLVAQKILSGERPGRPEGAQGAWFTTDLWEMLQRCWRTQPGDRPSLSAVLQCLQETTGPSRPPSDVDGDVDDQVHAAAGSQIAYGMVNPDEGWIGGRLARGARKIFKVTD